MSWSRSKGAQPEVYPSVIDGIKKIYARALKPLEEMYAFDKFHMPIMRDSDFDAKPSVLFLGQYSTGKTSFIRYLLEGNYPGANIGPEPTTDRFVAIMGGKEEMIIPGNALVVQNGTAFRALARFGNDFLNKFQASITTSPVLEDLVLIDSPGVLSGEKQRIGRSYDFTGVIEWFAQRADMIVLVFDANKLDISDEFKRAIEALRGQDDKIRVVLNKADGVNSQQLLRVYGALMWSLGKVINTPEVTRVYVGSFWEQPYKNTEFARLFDDYEHYRVGEKLPPHWTAHDQLSLSFSVFQKMPWLMPTMCATPHSHLADGCMDVAYATSEAFSRIRFMHFFNTLADGSHASHPKLTYLKVRAFTLEPSDGDGYVGVDGERITYAPTQFHVAPGLVCFCCYQ